MKPTSARLRLPALLSAALLAGFGCGRSSARQNSDDASHDPPRPTVDETNRDIPLPEISAGAEEGFHDLTFAIAGYQRETTGSQRIVARGKHRGSVVEFVVILGQGWGERDIGVPELKAFKGDVELRRAGAGSDQLLRALDTLYETKLGVSSLAPSTKFTGLSLEGTPSDPSAGPVKIKLFFEDGNDNDYAEAFLNVDLAHSKLELREKDPEYRSALVRALSTRK